jgi:hypothetical protein
MSVSNEEMEDQGGFGYLKWPAILIVVLVAGLFIVKQDNAEKFETSRAAIAEDPSFGAYNGVKAGSQGYAIGKGDVYEK